MDAKRFQKLIQELDELARECDEFLRTDRRILWDADLSCPALPPRGDEAPRRGDAPPLEAQE